MHTIDGIKLSRRKQIFRRSAENPPIDCSAILYTIMPDQLLVNTIPHELANVACSNPVCFPYIHIDYSKRTWGPAIVEREIAMTSFRNKMKNSKSPQPLSIQKYVLYRWRFAMDAALFGAFGRFGGAVAQNSNLSIITQNAIVGNPNISMLYGEELHNRLAKYARGRNPAIDFTQLIFAVRVDILRTAPQRAARSTTQRPPIKKGGVRKSEEANAINAMVKSLKEGCGTYRCS